MANELWDTLLRFHREVAVPDTLEMLQTFHREVAVPDIERIVGRVDGKIDRLRDEMQTNFDALWKRLERLESEYQALSAAV